MAEALFAKYDDDKNGLISIDEFTVLVKAEEPQVASIESLFKELDTDGDGNISINEFRPFFTCQQNFKKYDGDQNGLISADEFAPLVAGTEPTIPAASVPALFKEIDSDGDGNVSITEYVHFYQAKIVDKYRK